VVRACTGTRWPVGVLAFPFLVSPNSLVLMGCNGAVYTLIDIISGRQVHISQRRALSAKSRTRQLWRMPVRHMCTHWPSPHGLNPHSLKAPSPFTISHSRDLLLASSPVVIGRDLQMATSRCQRANNRMQYAVFTGMRTRPLPIRSANYHTS
jgi:hypothetical protein